MQLASLGPSAFQPALPATAARKAQRQSPGLQFSSLSGDPIADAITAFSLSGTIVALIWAYNKTKQQKPAQSELGRELLLSTNNPIMRRAVLERYITHPDTAIRTTVLNFAILSFKKGLIDHDALARFTRELSGSRNLFAWLAVREARQVLNKPGSSPASSDT